MKILLTLLSLLIIISCENEDTEFNVTEAAENISGSDITMDDDVNKENPDIPAPNVTSAGVVTILLALGDIANEGLVISEESARAIAQNAISFATPVENPKVLVVQDHNHNGETWYDTKYIKETLLKNYAATLIEETSSGLSVSDFEGFDVIWFNNPGHAMGSVATKNALEQFSGGVILSGDDLTQGEGFSLEGLTGLKHKNNGTSATCGGQSYSIDNNTGHQYKVALEGQFMEGVASQFFNFNYGNDIDHSELSNSDSSKYQVLAYADGPVADCDLDLPVIVRYAK